MFKRMISFLLAIIMALTTLPLQALASDEITAETTELAETIAEETESTETTAAEETMATEETVVMEETVPLAEEKADAVESGIQYGGPISYYVEDGVLYFSGNPGLWVDITAEEIAQFGGRPWYYFPEARGARPFEEATSIGDRAFMNYDCLEYIYIPISVERIGEYAFYGCDNLTTVYYMGSQMQWENISVESGNEVLEQATVHFEGDSTVVSNGRCGDNLIWEWNGVDTVTISGTGPMYDYSDETEQDWYALFQSDTALVIQEGVTSIGAYAFYGCTRLISISIPESVTSIGEGAFYSCSFLPEITLPDSMTSIGDQAFFNCFTLTNVIIPENVTDLGAKAFAFCSGLSWVCFTGDAPVFGDDVFYHYDGHRVTACYPGENNTWTSDVMQKYGGNVTWRSYTPGKPPAPPATSYQGEVSYYSETTAKANLTVHLDYADSFFSNSSYRYNHDLARASLKLAMSAFAYKSRRKGGSQGDARNAYDFLQKIGCAEEEITDYGYDKAPTADSIACVVGSKPLANDETLVIVAIRGQGYAAEWGGNFRVGPSWVYHQGFEKAAITVEKNLNQYLEDNTQISGDINLWITGFSRAAATANLVAGRLINGDAKLPDRVKLEDSDLFAYTFETPAGVQSRGKPRSEQYQNIFNIINSADFVPKVAPAIWGFERYGVDCFLPDLSEEWSYAVGEKYRYLTGREYVSPFAATYNELRQSLFLDKAIDAIGFTAGYEIGYVYEYQHNIIKNCVENNGLPSLDVIADEHGLVGVALLNAGKIATILNNAEALKFSHFPENCLAMMETMTGKEEYDNGKYKCYIIKCPVDIRVIDDSGSTVAAIENDAVTNLGNQYVDVFVDENGDKYVFILDDSRYELELTATDDGVMDCTVVTFQEGRGKQHQSAFFDVPLVKGEQYTASFSMEESDYTLVNEDGREITPDAVMTGEELQSASVEAEVIGEGRVRGASGQYTIGDTVTLTAEAEAGYLFGGWFDGDILVSADAVYSFGLRANQKLTALFLMPALQMEALQEYVVLECTEGKSCAQMAVKVSDEHWQRLVTWHAESAAGIIQVDANGLVTAMKPGTDYAVAEAVCGPYRFTARCRVDVAETETVEAVETIRLDGVSLGETRLTVELYSTNYTQMELLLKLPQNYIAMSRPAKEQQSVVIEEAYFTDSIPFCIQMLDDRRARIIPSATALENPDTVDKSYSSTITVVVDGESYETETLTLTVKQTLPKPKVTVDVFNSFFSGQSLPIQAADLTVTQVNLDRMAKIPLPDWLKLEEDRLVLMENAPKKSASGKACLELMTEEWAVPIPVTVTVKNVYKVPGLKLNASGVQLSGQKDASKGVRLRLQPKDKRQTLQELQVTGISAPTGYAVENYNTADGTFILKAAEEFAAGKILLRVQFANTKQTLDIPVTVKTASVKLKLAATSLTLNAKTGDAAQVDVTATPEDYMLTQPVFRLTDQAGKDVLKDGLLEIGFETGRIFVNTTEFTPAGQIYKLYISAGNSKEAVLTIKTVDKAPAVKLNQTGDIDLSFPEAAATIQPTFTNYGGKIADFAYSVTETKSGEDITAQFELKEANGGFSLTCIDPVMVSEKGAYTLDLKLTLSNGEELNSSLKLKVKRTAIKLKLSGAKLTLNKAVHDSAAVVVTCTTKGYQFVKPVWEAVEGLNISWINGKLQVSTNANTEYGTTYKVILRAATGAEPTVLTVAIPESHKSAVASTLKAKGNIDVIRAHSAIVLTPAYKNCSAETAKEEKLIFFKTVGKEQMEVNELFAYAVNDDGTFTVTRAADAKLDHSGKYTVQMVTTINETEICRSKPIALPVKMGTAKLTLTAEDTILFAKDIRDRVIFSVNSADDTLNDVFRIEIKDASYKKQFEIFGYDNGEFALGFKNGKVDTSLIGKSVTLNLSVYMDGNESAKENATVKVKVTVIP